MTWIDYLIVGLVVIAAVAAIVRSIRKPGCGCGQGCSGCAQACSCKEKSKSE